MNALPQAIAGANIHIGNHGWEVERRDPCRHAQAPDAWSTYLCPGPALSVIFTFQQLRRSNAIFHDFQTPDHVAFGVWHGLAVLAAQGLGQFVHVAVQ